MGTPPYTDHGAITLSPTISLANFIIDDGCSLQRKTPLQLQTLENLYSDDKHPTQSRLEDYASALGLTREQVRRWFIERRRRNKQNAARIGNESAGRTTKGEGKRKKKNSWNFELGNNGNNMERPDLVQDMLYSPGYILKNVFRKDGPPLGVEFDALPSQAFQVDDGIAERRCSKDACPDEQRALKKRKVSKPAALASEQQNQTKTPMKKHGVGKGLMSIWQLVDSHASCQDAVGTSKRRKVLPCDNSSPVKRHGMGKGFMTASQLANPNSKKMRNRRQQRRKPVTWRRSGNKVQEKRKPPVRRTKVESIQNKNQKAQRESCKLALNLASYEANLCSYSTLPDDEELELRELQAGPNPLTCGAHFSAGGSSGCSLCKGLLARFPPDSVRMKRPISMHPWDSSLEVEKKFFKVFHFLCTYAVIIDICPFTIDEFVKAFHDKDSLLLGKLHICLLGLLLSDIERELSNGLSIHSNKNCMYLNLLYTAENKKFVVDFWKMSLNPLTWTEILRQVMVAAGFGSNYGMQRKGCLNKEEDHMVKYGLRPGTLKGELFSILLEQGNKGLKVTELAKSSQIEDLNLGKTNGELEDSICSILASDITLFEKISSYTYRLRFTSIMKNDEDDQSDNEDCGSIDDESRESSVPSINYLECDAGNSSSRPDTWPHPGETNTLSLCTEIDESHPGESWLLGLMEGEYSDLSIEEKLNALLALVDLLSAGSSLKMEDSSTVHAEYVPRIYQHGSGGKIKRSTVRQPVLQTSPWSDIRETYSVENGYPSSEFCAVDSSVVSSKEKSGKKRNSKRTATGDDLHPMQSIFLGSDRRYNRYWLFLGPCDADDPGHKRVYFESSEDGHWKVIDSEEALCGLLMTLNSQGRREAILLASLKKCTTYLLEEMSSRVAVDAGVSQSTQSDVSEIGRVHEDSPSPVSEIDSLSLGETSHNTVVSSDAAVFDVEKVEEQKQKYARLQAYDLWIWNCFYSDLYAVKHGKQSFFDSWTRCGSCHDLYWRDERHCKTCHTTFELDFDLEEKYTIHVATCQGSEDADIYPIHKVLPSHLQALKATIYAIELAMPEDALIGAWKKSAQKLWVRRLRRTSSLHEVSQVLADFVGAINLGWLSQCNVVCKCGSTLEDIVECFQSMPQTSSALALWLVKLDVLIAPHLDKGVEDGTTKGKRNR